ncbi:hypothetical protein BJF95_18250 [Rhizobium oryziradicis]|uniref:Uncharacterized protein n=2 Tax=Rhizobium oryziradicis TaxID=1867956 RepID=A0A1Q8ZTQ9_9HYPH|nr:hypothetical protein BJF95_18250 [Rhizobium oryziradicis]
MSKKEKAKKAADLERLRLQFPGTYSDFVAGRIASVRSALKITGIRPERTRVQKLKNSWKKATPKERQEFVNWLTAEGETDLPPQTKPSPLPEAPIANGRYLLPQTIQRMEAIMTARGITPAEVMQDMGFGANDRSLLRAMARKTCLRLKVIEALKVWLQAQEAKSLTP